jgi:hypothetical protein
MVRDVEVIVGNIKYHADFVVPGCPLDEICPIIFVDMSYIQ